MLKHIVSGLLIAAVGILYFQGGWVIIGKLLGNHLVPAFSFILFPLLLAGVGYKLIPGAPNEKLNTLMIGFFPVLMIEGLTKPYWQPVALLAGSYFVAVISVWFAHKILNRPRKSNHKVTAL